ncbi:pyridoxamine 5'-phosphate oxidase family protein [Streptomyces sp. NPDC004232]|uniref:pyridoxamine 5'-phosphate oxidase family protein n=1 Tax=Streptomyces sp. NPDC004232 TaxID=3154454 RepID=UPI0033BC4283
MSPSETPSDTLAVRPDTPAPRRIAQRRADTERLLTEERHLWLASNGPRPHMIPLSYVFDGGVITMLTRRSGRTGRNLAANGRARVAFGSAADVVLIDGIAELTDPAEAPPEMRARYARLPLDPDRVPDAVGVCLVPHRVLAWRSLAEVQDRLIMDDGIWLA